MGLFDFYIWAILYVLFLEFFYSYGRYLNSIYGQCELGC